MAPDERTLLVPDGLEGERVDAAIARLFGLSRTKAADLAAAGHVSLNHRPAVKSDRVSAGDLLADALRPGRLLIHSLSVVTERVGVPARGRPPLLQER